MEKIEIPAARMPRILNLLGLSDSDVCELVILPDGGLVKRYKLNQQRERVFSQRYGCFETETVELVFTTGERDPMFSSSVERDGE